MTSQNQTSHSGLDKSAFDYLRPTTEQQLVMEKVRGHFSAFAEMLEEHIPPGPDKTYLLRKLRECGMWANVAITRNGDGSPRI
jgi:hypothetical protein